MRFAVGQALGRYVIESLLGEGGMGEVYRARDSKLERAVAVKVLRNDTEGSSEDWEHAVMRMQREAQAVAALSHPGIVAIYDIGEHEGAPFIAMELVGGQPLRDLIGTEAPFETRLRMLLDVAKALGAAHEAGFVHRDIKPENILVRPDGVTKILDFGIARKTSRAVDPSSQTLDLHGAAIDAAFVGMTAEGALVGTPAYMSPEQLRGETADARADQFAWGVVAYELFQGKHPFQAEKGAIGLLAAILGEAPAPMDKVPADIAVVVLRALEKDPDKRWASMQEIVQQCDDFVADGDVRKSPPAPRSERMVTPSQTSSATAVPVTPSRAWWVLAPALVAMAFLALFAFGKREPVAPAVAVSSAVVATKPVATAVTDLQMPTSSNPTAVLEYRRGMQNIRDARWTAAAIAFQHARQADPGMAIAHLRFAIIQFSFDVTSARDAYRNALGLRTTMTERDQGFMHALEPVILREASDYSEASRRMEALVARYPLDAELLFWQSRLTYHHSWSADALQRVIELDTRCVELDPQYADCWQTKAGALLASGKQEEAAKALGECMTVSENAVDCILDKIEIESHLGHCDEVVQLAQRLKTKDPVALHAWTVLAEALYLQGASEAVVRTAFDEAQRRARELGREYDSHQAKLMFLVDTGDFEAAAEQANFMAHKLTSPSVEAETGLFMIRSALYLEMGRLKQAAAVADEFFVAQAFHPNTSKKIQINPTMLMHSIRLQAGKINAGEYRKLRTEWIEKQPRGTDFDRAIVWLAGYATPATTVELANEALQNIPPEMREKTQDNGRFSKPFVSFRGRALILAGQHAEAIPYLETATCLCTTDEISLSLTQTTALLGMAREATGDKPGACEAYQRVLSRWGKSKQSVTAKDAGKRAKKLGCESTASHLAP